MSSTQITRAHHGDEFDLAVYFSNTDIGTGAAAVDLVVRNLDHTRWISAVELKDVMLDGIPVTGSEPDYHFYAVKFTGGFFSPTTTSNNNAAVDSLVIPLTGERTHHSYDSRFIGKYTSAHALNQFRITLARPSGAPVPRDDLTGFFMLFRCYTGPPATWAVSQRR